MAGERRFAAWGVVAAMLAVSCETAPPPEPEEIAANLTIVDPGGGPILARPRELPAPSGAAGAHACVRGAYTHRWAHGSEVYLCCVPLPELLSPSFHCAPPFGALASGSDYSKVRFCHLQHPTSPEPRLLRVCILAPLQAPGLD